MKRKMQLAGTGLALALMLAAFLGGCRKDDTPATTPPAGGTRLEKIVDGEDQYEFRYQADGRLREAVVKNDLVTGGDPVRLTVQYDGQNRISRLQGNDGRTWNAFYEGTELEKVETRDAANRLESFTSYEYLNGRLKSSTLHYLHSGEVTPWMKFIFQYDAAGNITRTNLFFNDFLTNQLVSIGHVLYTYDNKTNPLSELRNFLLFIWQNPSVNNVTGETHVGPENTIDERVEYTYQYNGRGLPQQATAIRMLPGTTPQQSQLQFLYR